MVWLSYDRAWGKSYRTVYEPQAVGHCVVSADDIQPFKFQGQMFDGESNLHYNRFRYYDYDVGMFIQRDPIGLMGGNNVFAYAPNPVQWIDPLGLAGKPVKINVSGEPNGNYAYMWAYPDGDPSVSYRVPLYNITLQSGNKNVTYEGIRFGPRYTKADKKWSVAGLADEQSHKLTWYPSYKLHSDNASENGAWIVTGDFLIHDGSDTSNPRELGSNIGTAGCVEIYGVRGFSRFNQSLLELSGVKNLSQINAIVHYEKARRPQLGDFPVWEPPKKPTQNVTPAPTIPTTPSLPIDWIPILGGM